MKKKKRKLKKIVKQYLYLIVITLSLLAINQVTFAMLLGNIDELLKITVIGTNSIDLISPNPISDDEVDNYLPYTFTITNNSSVTKKYNILLEDDADSIINDDCDTIDKSNLNILVNNTKKTYNDYLNNGKYILLTTEIPAHDTLNTTIKIWIKDSTVESSYFNKHYHGTVYYEEVGNYKNSNDEFSRYLTLSDAIHLAEDNDTIELLSNYNDNSNVVINKNIVLDLNNYTLERTKEITINNNYVVDIKGDGKILNNTTSTFVNNGRLSLLEDVIIESTSSKYTIINNNILNLENKKIIGNTSKIINNSGSLNIDEDVIITNTNS